MARLRISFAVTAGVAVILLAACLVATRLQLEHWKNSVALWQHATQVTEASVIPFFYLGDALQTRAAAYAEAKQFGSERRTLQRAGEAYDRSVKIAGDPKDASLGPSFAWVLSWNSKATPTRRAFATNKS